ncbi:ankyrin repeat domain-containing protein [Clostridium scatologenes]|uniref:Ankyrin repeat-containing protein n=1 Tax=Clostridium scatologenes TaxID=1548 RepID=A0A0E3JR95_CLOSL|nr:ankyrin repeat domain-containing protein [Clostridium scatologenes]AKA71554.1 ankyrin repeat-containing protein [Clostridium scatologenes]
MGKKSFFIVSILIIIACSLGSCYLSRERSNKSDEEGNKMYNVGIYKDTPAWELALAVRDEKTKTIEKIVKDNSKLLNYQDPKDGVTLLLWAVGTERYKSAEALLKCGADPNIASTNTGETPLFTAAGYSWIDNDYKKDDKYVKLLLKYGANPNKNNMKENKSGYTKTVIDPGESPLMNSIGCGIEKTKDLVEGGADINHKSKSGRTAAIAALESIGPNAVTSENIQYAYYLIVEKKAKIVEPYYRPDGVAISGDNPNDKFYPVDLLRDCIPKLESKEYKMKMEIVKEFANQGVNYWDTKIPKNRLSQIKKLYPDTWEEYIKKY